MTDQTIIFKPKSYPETIPITPTIEHPKGIATETYKTFFAIGYAAYANQQARKSPYQIPPLANAWYDGYDHAIQNFKEDY